MHSESLKGAEQVLNELQAQLSKLREFEANTSKEYSVVSRSIIVHFDECFQALEKRKVWLLSEAEAKFNDQKEQIQEAENQLQKTITACKELIRAGEAIRHVDSGAASQTWQVTPLFLKPTKEISKVSVDLSTTIIDAISNQGQVKTSVVSLCVDESPLAKEPSPREVPSAQLAVFPSAASVKLSPRTAKAPKETYAAYSTSSFSSASSESATFSYADDLTTQIDGVVAGRVTTMYTAQPVNCRILQRAISALSYDPFRGICLGPDGKLFVCCDSTINVFSKTGECSVFANIEYDDEYVTAFGIMYLPDERCIIVTLLHRVVYITLEGSSSSIRHKSFDGLRGVAMDYKSKSIYLCDNFKLYKISPDRTITILAGTGKAGRVDGAGATAQFNTLRGICYHEPSQSVIVCDNQNNCLRSVSVLDGTTKSLTRIEQPVGITALQSGELLVTARRRIYAINLGLSVTVRRFAGSGKKGNEDGDAAHCSFTYPYGIVADEQADCCYVTDRDSKRVRIIQISNHE